MYATTATVTVNASRAHRKTTTTTQALNRSIRSAIAPIDAQRRSAVVVHAKEERKLDGPILRQNEKEGAWLSEAEKDGANPLKDPMALIGIGGLTVPFIILLVANAAGLIGQ